MSRTRRESRFPGFRFWIFALVVAWPTPSLLAHWQEKGQRTTPGQVIDHNGDPAPRVSIRLYPELNESDSLQERLMLLTRGSKLEVVTHVLTNRQGAFELKCPPGRYRLLVTTQAGATLQQRRVRLPTPKLEIELPHQVTEVVAGTTDLSLQLVPGRTVAGRVLDSVSKKPVVDARLNISVHGMTQSARANESGEFELTGLLPEPTKDGPKIRVIAPGYSRTLHSDTQLAEIEILADPLATVAGTVLTPAGVPVDGAMITAKLQFEESSVPIGFQRLKSKGDGTFSISGIDPKKGVILELDHPDWPSQAVRLRPCDPGERRMGVRVAFARPLGVVGRVTDTDGRPIVGATVGVRDFESLQDQRTAIATSRTDAEGRYRISGLASGGFELVVEAPGFAQFVRPIRGDHGQVLEIDAQLSAAFTLRGRVLNQAGAPVANARVRVTDTSDDFESFETTTDEQGHFVVRGLRSEPVKVRIESSGRRSKHSAKPGQAKTLEFVIE